MPESPQTHQKAPVPSPERTGVKGEISRIIDRNNLMADIIESAQFQALLKEEHELRGNAKVGAVVCIDGRVGTMHVFGRTVNVWEEPAALMPTSEDGKLKSPRFTETIVPTAQGDRDLLEIVTSHKSSTTDHDCGRVMAGQRAHEPGFDPAKSPKEVARTLIIGRTIPAVTQRYQRIQEMNRKIPLKKVAVPMEIDTDTLGLELLTPEGKDGYSSARELMRPRENGQSLKDRIEFVASEQIGVFGIYKNHFTDVDHFVDYYSHVVSLTKAFMEDPSNIFGLRREIDAFVETNYSDLTAQQKQAVVFTLSRSVAMGYLTGLAEVGEHGPHHAFAHHEETNRMALSLSGKTVGRFDPEEQIFGSTPSTPEEARSDVKIKLGLLDGNPHSTKPYILFLSEPVDRRMWEERAHGNETVTRTLGMIHELHQHLMDDETIKMRVDKDELVLVPVIVDESSGRVLEQLHFEQY